MGLREHGREQESILQRFPLRQRPHRGRGCGHGRRCRGSVHATEDPGQQSWGLRLSAGCGMTPPGLVLQVAARAEVAPGEKVVGIDLGTTNSAVAAMEAAE